MGDISDDIRENEMFRTLLDEPDPLSIEFIFSRLFPPRCDPNITASDQLETKMGAKETQIEALLREVEEKLGRIKELEDEPDDDFPDGAVVVWRKTFADQTFSYVALKVEPHDGSCEWIVAGKIGWTSWSNLLRHLQRADPDTAYWATQMTELQL